jgi:branched-chain amino acid transport system permease protein
MIVRGFFLPMDVLLANFLIGISFGFILFLLGTGLSLTMGLMRIVNLAHGALYMVGGYTGLYVAGFTEHLVGRDLSFVLGLLAGGICAGGLGLIMETGFLRRLYKRDLDQVLLTIGFIYILTNLVHWVWGPVPMSGVIPSILSGSIPVGRINLPVFRLAIIAFGIVAAIVLWLFQEKTRVGAIIRAGMDNKEMTMGLGINLKVIFSGVFALGAFVAGFCGLIGAPLLGINLGIGWDALLFAMIVVIVGGTGSVQGALTGGIIIGLVDAYGKAFFPELAYFTIYLVLITILLFRPSGLMGRAI